MYIKSKAASFFFAVALFIHDPVYRIPSPGKLLDTVETWGEHLEKLGGSNTAYWPNEPLEIPLEVRAAAIPFQHLPPPFTLDILGEWFSRHRSNFGFSGTW